MSVRCRTTAAAGAVLLAIAAVCAAAPAAPGGMMPIPAGVYEPLYRNEGERQVPAFFLDEAQVTNADFLEFVKANSRWQRSKALAIFTDAHYLEHWAGDLDLGEASRVTADGPGTNVSWFAAMAYAKWRGKRLPTQAEWEMAAAASGSSARGKDDPDHYRKILDWYAKPTRFPLPPVSEAPRDFHGVRGLHGVVWEWGGGFQHRARHRGVAGRRRARSQSVLWFGSRRCVGLPPLCGLHALRISQQPRCELCGS